MKYRTLIVSLILLLPSFLIGFASILHAQNATYDTTGSTALSATNVAYGKKITFTVNATMTKATDFRFQIYTNNSVVGDLTHLVGHNEDGERINCDHNTVNRNEDVKINVFNKNDLQCTAGSEDNVTFTGVIYTGNLAASTANRKYTFDISSYNSATENISPVTFTVLGVTDADSRNNLSISVSPKKITPGTGDNLVKIRVTGLDFLGNNATNRLFLGDNELFPQSVYSFSLKNGTCSVKEEDGFYKSAWTAPPSCTLDESLHAVMTGTLDATKILEIVGSEGLGEIDLTANPSFPLIFNSYSDRGGFLSRNDYFSYVGTTEQQTGTFTLTVNPTTGPYQVGSKIELIVKDSEADAYTYEALHDDLAPGQISEEIAKNKDCEPTGTVCAPVEWTLPATPALITITATNVSSGPNNGKISTIIISTVSEGTSIGQRNGCFTCPRGFSPGGTIEAPTCSARAKVQDINGNIVNTLITLNTISPEGLSREYISSDGNTKEATMEIQDDCGDSICKPGLGCDGKPLPPPGPPCLEYSFDGGVTTEIYDPENPPDQAYICTKTDTALIAGFATDPGGFVRQLLGFLLSISGGIALLLIIRSGYQMMTSTGNPEAIQEAKERITSAIVGLLFIIFSLIILQVIGVDILQIFPSV